jgi:hypothetical protein
LPSEVHQLPAPPPHPWRPMEAWTAGILAALGVWLIGFGGYPLIQWSSLNCTYEDIDIRTGRIRTTRILAGMEASERTEDSALTKALSAADLPPVEPNWRRVNTFSPGVHYSPHHAFHGAISQARYFDQLCQFYHFGPQAKREVALTILQLWREKGSYFAAGRLLSELELKLGESLSEPTDEAIRSAAVDALKRIREEEPPK